MVKNFPNKIRSFTFTGPALYIFSFLSYYVLSFMKLTTYTSYISQNVFVRLSYVLITILLMKIYFFDNNDAKWIITDTVFFLLSILVWRKTHSLDILMYVLLILGARNVNFRALINLFFKIGIILLVFTILSSQFGIIKDLVYLRNGVARHALGINYPTDLGAHIFFLLLSYCYLYFKKLNWKSYFVFLILSVFVLKLTQARLDFLAIIILIPVIYIAKKAFYGRRIYQNIASFYWTGPVILAYITILLAYFYSTSDHFLSRIDKLLSNRLNLSHSSIEQYGIHLFGNRVLEHGYGGVGGHVLFNADFSTMHYFFIDSSYIRLLVIYGVVMMVVFIGIMTVIALKSILKKDYCLAAIILMLSISCVVEQHLMDISFNPFLIALLANKVYLTKGTEKNSENL